MSEAVLDPVPPLRTAAAAQWKAVGLAVRREVLVAAVLLAAGQLYMGLVERATGEAIPLGYLDEIGVLAGAAAFLFPFFVWKGENSFGFSTLWTLPVGHARHALLKVAAGWAWVMVLTAGFGALMLLPVLITGGPLGEEFTRLVADPAAPSSFRPVEWSTPWWWWLLPFGAASTTYLLGSALVLATRRPWRWIVGTGLGLLLLRIGGVVGVDPMDGLFETLVSGVWLARYGVETLLNSGVQSIEVWLHRPSGEEVKAWRELPSLARWAGTVLLWSAVGLAGLLAATWRRREA
ncbi:MAG: hypothetical protein R3199_06400 [Gemmatimonadota bacterium]|nr:hypothetical protein [Gemmatimonadota bacterium]